MKIVHIVISGPFTIGMTYQENLLPIQNASDGHEVLVIASCLVWNGGTIKAVPEGEEFLDNGLKIIRIPYDFFFNEYFTEKIRKASKLIPIISRFNPDIVYLHDPQSFEILNLSKYKKKNNHILFIVDMHSNFKNSAKNIISYYFLHTLFYRSILAASKKYIDKMYCVDESSVRFLRSVYKYKEKNVEVFPLGGVSVRLSCKERADIRCEMHLQKSDIVFMHSGKIDKKKRTREILASFSECRNPRFKLLIAGSIEQEYEAELRPLMDCDNRISYLGWQDGEALMDLLAITDVYVQLGSASATLQNAICAGAAVVVADREIYGSIIKGNGWILDDANEFRQVLQDISRDESILDKMKVLSVEICNTFLSYEVLSKRMCEK